MIWCARFQNRNTSYAEMNYVPLFIWKHSNTLLHKSHSFHAVVCCVFHLRWVSISLSLRIRPFVVLITCIIIKVSWYIFFLRAAIVPSMDPMNADGLLLYAILYTYGCNMLFAFIDGCWHTVIACWLNLYNRLMNAIDLIRNWICGNQMRKQVIASIQ